MIYLKPNKIFAKSIQLDQSSGFTIIEAIVSLLVVALLLVAIAPPIIISVATRLQAKRIESATDAAKKYIDGLRSGDITTAPNIVSTTSFSQSFIAPAGGSLTCTSNNYCTTTTTYNLFCADIDGSGCNSSSTKNFVIQVLGYNPTTGSTSANGYHLGLRVYRPDAFADSSPALKISTPSSSAKIATFAGGLGDRKAPLVEMQTDITPSTAAFSDFCNRLKNASNSQSQC